MDGTTWEGEARSGIRSRYTFVARVFARAPRRGVYTVYGLGLSRAAAGAGRGSSAAARPGAGRDTSTRTPQAVACSTTIEIAGENT